MLAGGFIKTDDGSASATPAASSAFLIESRALAITLFPFTNPITEACLGAPFDGNELAKAPG